MICLAHAHTLDPTQQFCTRLCSSHIPQQVQQDKRPGEKKLGPEFLLRTVVCKHSQFLFHACLPEFASATGQGSKCPNTGAWPCQHLNKRLLSPAPRLSLEATDTQPVVSCYRFSGMGSGAWRNRQSRSLIEYYELANTKKQSRWKESCEEVIITGSF